MLNIQEYPPNLLRNYVAKYSLYRFGENIDTQLYPKGIFEIVFQSNTNFQHDTSYSAGWQNRPKNFIGGLHNKSYTVRANRNNNFCIAVEFKPNTAKYFIPYKLHNFQNNIVDILDIWGNGAIELSHKITAEKENTIKISLIEDFLLRRIIQQKTSIIDNAITIILTTKGFVEVSQLAKIIGLSKAQFRKRFKEEIGISPSQYCKIVRINTSLTLLEKGYKKSLIDLSYQLGYFDQSHFIKNFKSVTGCSPKSFKKLK